MADSFSTRDRLEVNGKTYAYASLEKLDLRLVEAAFDLGADRRRVLRRVIIPLAMPGIVATPPSGEWACPDDDIHAM